MITTEDTINSNKRQTQPADNEVLWTVEEVSSFLRLTQNTVRIMARDGKIPATKIGSVWRFNAEMVKNLFRH